MLFYLRPRESSPGPPTFWLEWSYIQVHEPVRIMIYFPTRLISVTPTLPDPKSIILPLEGRRWSLTNTGPLAWNFSWPLKNPLDSLVNWMLTHLGSAAFDRSSSNDCGKNYKATMTIEWFIKGSWASFEDEKAKRNQAYPDRLPFESPNDLPDFVWFYKSA